MPSKKIDLSPIENKISTTAFELFRQWTKNAKEEFPKLDFTIKDETKLVDSCRKSIEGSIKSLYRQKKFKNNSFMLGWDIGFIYGFIQGNLDTGWQHEYITKQSNRYKNFMALKALQMYFKFDEVALLKTEDIYQALLENDSNLENLNLEVPELDLEIEKNPKPKKNKEKVKTVIDNLIIKKIIKLNGKREFNFLSDLDEFISGDEVRALISGNEWLKESWKE